MEDCARLILLHCVNNFRGDEKVKSFVADLICPHENANSITRNHSGLANPVSRGGRKSKKKDKPLRPEKNEYEDWMKDDKFETELHLDPAFIKHLSKNSNKVLLRIRMLYYIKQEIISNKSAHIDLEIPISEIGVIPSSLLMDPGPVDWWDKDADASLLAGTYKHGYERYNIMRQDPALSFLGKCGPPDGSAVLAEISAEV
jgi:chromodomain-helicase-DNA-binding protein 7